MKNYMYIGWGITKELSAVILGLLVFVIVVAMCMLKSGDKGGN